MIAAAPAVPAIDIPPAIGPAAALARRVVDLGPGPLRVRLAEAEVDIAAAQALRHCIFYQRMGARPLPGMAQQRRDGDRFDATCDPLLVLDHDRPARAEGVGTYRLLRRAREFNTTDVCVIIDTELVTHRYSRHYVRQSKEIWTA